MNRTRTFITLIGWLASFAWLLAPEIKASPAVPWPSVRAVGLAFSSDCDVMAHVWTRLPYALTAAFIAKFLGYLAAGQGTSPGWLLGAGATVCWLPGPLPGKEARVTPIRCPS